MVGIAGSAVRTTLAAACAVVIALCLTVAGTVNVAVNLATLERVLPQAPDSLDDLLALDAQARAVAAELCAQRAL